MSHPLEKKTCCFAQNVFTRFIEAHALAVWLDARDLFCLCLVSRAQYHQFDYILIQRMVWPIYFASTKLSPHRKKHVQKIKLDKSGKHDNLLSYFLNCKVVKVRNATLPKCLPSTLTTLEISSGFCKGQWTKLPSNLTELSIVQHSKFNGALNLPESIISLNLNHKYTDLSNISNLTNLTELQFTNTRSQCYFLPSSLRKLRIACCNKPLLDEGTILPSMLVTLMLRNVADISLTPKTFPTTLTSLYLDCNRPLEPNVLPTTLTWLDLEEFDQDLKENVLPPNLQTLRMPCFDKQLSIGILPTSLTKLEIGNGFCNSIATLYTNLTSLTFYFREIFDKGNFPPNLLKLVLRYDDAIIKLKPFLFPSSLKALCLPEINFELQCGDIFPVNLTSLKLELNPRLVCIMNDVLPNSLIKLDIICNANQLPSILPQTLTDLTFRSYSLDHFLLPPHITTLFLCVFRFSSMQQNENSVLLKTEHFNNTTSLTSLKLGHFFNQSLDNVQLPKSLLHLDLSYFFEKKISSDDLPPNLKTLTMSNTPQNYKHLNFQLRSKTSGSTTLHFLH